MDTKGISKHIGASSLILTLVGALGYQPLLSIAEDMVTVQVNSRIDGIEQVVKDQESKANERYQSQLLDMSEVKAETKATNAKMDTLIMMLQQQVRDRQ